MSRGAIFIDERTWSEETQKESLIVAYAWCSCYGRASYRLVAQGLTDSMPLEELVEDYNECISKKNRRRTFNTIYEDMINHIEVISFNKLSNEVLETIKAAINDEIDFTNYADFIYILNENYVYEYSIDADDLFCRRTLTSTY